MFLPSNFKQIISDTFYDKEIDIYSVIEEIGEELDVIRKKGDLIQEGLKCNVHQTSNDIILKNYGLSIEANIMITCNNANVKIGEIITYKEQDYIVTGKLEFDSHIKLFAKVGDING